METKASDGLSAENRALLERVWSDEAQRRVPTSFYRTLNIALDAARAEEMAKVRAQWNGDDICSRLDDVRRNIAGLRPGDAQAIAAFQQEFAARGVALAKARGEPQSQGDA